MLYPSLRFCLYRVAVDVEDLGAAVVAVRPLVVNVAPTPDQTKVTLCSVVDVEKNVVKHLSYCCKVKMLARTSV